MVNPKHDYLKFFRVIRYFFKKKYELTEAELDMLLFLYSEGRFSKDNFDSFNELISWKRNRFESLRQRGWIEVFRAPKKGRRALYQLSYKAVKMIESLYKKLEGQDIPSSYNGNPLLHRNVSYMDKVYRNFIKDMRKSTKRPPHPHPE